MKHVSIAGSMTGISELLSKSQPLSQFVHDFFSLALRISQVLFSSGKYLAILPSGLSRTINPNRMVTQTIQVGFGHLGPIYDDFANQFGK